jgi:hypothetical protein
MNTKPPTLRLPLNMAKLVEMRRRTRIDRSRQIANNNEFQRNLMDTIRVYNDETERNRALNELETSMGPSLAWVHLQIRARVISSAPVDRVQTEAQANAYSHVRTLTVQNRDRRARLATAPVSRAAPKSKFKLTADQTRLDSYDQ